MATGSDRTPRSKGRLGRLAGAVTGRVVETIDPDIVIDQVDLDHMLERVDLDRALSRVDVNALLDRVDVNRLLDRVDVDALLDRVDVNRLMARVDVDALLETVDLEAAVRRAGVPEIVAESTGRVAGSALDLARRQIVGLDVIVDRVVNRLLRRDPADQPPAPPALAARSTP
jgi:hypothetical protein